MCFAENSILLMKCSFFCATLNLADILDRLNAKSEIRGNNTRFKTQENTTNEKTINLSLYIILYTKYNYTH